MFSRVFLSTAISGIFSYGPQIIPITMRLVNFDGKRLRRPCSAISPKAAPPISIEKVFLPQSLALRFVVLLVTLTPPHVGLVCFSCDEMNVVCD
ncbi:hypothetical protein F2Q70_00027490 [Brassica cretica]|uniref:Uncharacterized protein n=1 Tax=Brassica cretica TaxID=69181 RepID=A0A8S9L563_BRACR|nr:hypothetical protein F2Q70_00027490 [Brassica cretica]